MNKTVRKVLYIIAFSLAIGAFIYLGDLEYGDEKKILSDSEKFSNEYNISKENPFVYVNSKKVLDLLDGETGYLLIGFSSDDWTKEYVKYLSEVFSDCGISEVYYYDVLKDRTEMTKNYEKILTKLEDYLVNTDTKESYLFVPKFLVIQNGVVVYENDRTALVKGKVTPEEYWTANSILEFKNEISANLVLESENING